jgi:hypothetical protein
MDKDIFTFLAFLLIAVVVVTCIVMIFHQESEERMMLWDACQRAYRCYGEDLQVHSGWVDSGNGAMSVACDCLNLTSGEFLSEHWAGKEGESHA